MAQRKFGPEPKYQLVSNSVPYYQQKLIEVAGPCSVESEEQIHGIAKCLSALGVSILRGGFYRAGTYPPENPGVNPLAFRWFHEAAKANKMQCVAEVIDLRLLDHISRWADVLQVGARQMQNYGLLQAIAETKMPCLIKRNMGATLDEFLGAAEYLMRGCRRVILVERGSSIHLNHVRWELSVSTIAAIKAETGMTVLVDPSHGSGRVDLVEPLLMAGIAAGADGFIVETHPNPSESLSDAQQAYPLERFPALLQKARAYWELNMTFKETQ